MYHFNEFGVVFAASWILFRTVKIGTTIKLENTKIVCNFGKLHNKLYLQLHGGKFHRDDRVKT